MEFDELLITTGVDALVRIVKDRQKIELEEASSALNIGQETLEEWARVLEEEGILRMEYRLTRIYLVWVKPTEEEVAGEVKSFYESKKGIEAEVAKAKEGVAEQTRGFEELRKSFQEFYAKAYPRIDRLEKEVSALPSAKALMENTGAKQQAALQDIRAKLEEVKGEVESSRSELRSLEIGKEGGEGRGWMEKVERVNGELASMKAELQALKKKAAQQAPEGVTLPGITELKKKFEAVNREFAELRSKNARMRQDMISLHESSEILRGVAESIMGHEEKVAELHAEMSVLSTEVDALMKKAKELSAKVKETAELTDRFESTAATAKGVLTRFPAQEKVMAEIERLLRAEEALAEKYDALEKLLEAAGGKQVTAKQFAELTKRMDEKSYQLQRDMDSLAGALEDEKATYLTFQKIKERVVPAMEAYQAQLDKLGAEMDALGKESMSREGLLEEDARKLQAALRGGEAQEALKAAQEITDKKEMLDDIMQSMEDLSALSESLTKRITLLSREAKLLEIRAGGAPEGPDKEARKEELRQELRLTEEEEMEFRRKREELRNLIKKLWE